MRILVLGGTIFLSKAVAEEALRRGHDVVCAVRGVSGQVPAGAVTAVVDRSAPEGLAALAGERFDAVVDVARISFPWVRDALEKLAKTTKHWTFVSTISVYADNATTGQGVDGKLVEPLVDDAAGLPTAEVGERYGRIKVASENAVREVFGEDAFIPRPGLITGPGDLSDRFGYWPARFARGGRVLVPDAPAQPFQHIDARDFAAWIVLAAEQRLGGTFDAISEPAPLPEFLGEVQDALGVPAELVRAPEAKLTELEIKPWGGPGSLPLWLPADYAGMTSHQAQPALDAGLTIRSAAETAVDTLAWERELGLDRERKAGLSPAQEAEVLASL
ncbi:MULTISPECIES: NAD-dependent epimerase/dehydratase family protein [unclassified Crossiella]|uniref:NAD-dependent epimerase/dehydratase family protein n=1 Tax=unclassified Crossiella TaxID=2620835 RepID=UPI0020000F4B|nr:MULTISPECIES: NAD-dependent epimerase/dehydratase family protein [unclassified Crossiella]MCK2236494.1 epimerase [Crossiella sp. S99.2]MCK2250161.1 epimerase [Crossiella sp. S99.1]